MKDEAARSVYRRRTAFVALAESRYSIKAIAPKVIPTTPRTIAMRPSFLPGDMFMLSTLDPCRCTCQSM